AAISFSLIKLVIAVNQSTIFHFLDSATLIEAALIDRIYLGLLCVLSILVSYQSMKNTYHPDNKYYLINIVINVLFIMLIVSRISIIVLIIVFLASFFFKRKRLPQLFFITASLLLGIVLTFILNKDLRKEIFYARYVQNDGLVANTLETEPRLMIWECANQISQMEDTFWNGQGFANTKDQLLECYDGTIENEEKRGWFVQKKYNTHNQFIDLYLSTGIIGFVLFLGSILVVFVRNRKTYFPSALLITLVCFLAVENLFHRQIGAYYVGFVLIAIVIAHQTKEKEALDEV
ncbi:MAG: O-antigen ligase family protein, partial [Bacteroidetes bacterium]|nr:O-antigen ligase family protein [Bacteroidota bacterium]